MLNSEVAVKPNRRVGALRNAKSERWVVLSEDESELVAEGASFEDAAKAAKEKGMNDPVVLFIPSDWVPRIF